MGEGRQIIYEFIHQELKNEKSKAKKELKRQRKENKGGKTTGKSSVASETSEEEIVPSQPSTTTSAVNLCVFKQDLNKIRPVFVAPKK